MKNTKIEWADHSWNPWRGCTKVSPGCANCYAERQAKRNPKVLGKWGKGAPRVSNKNWAEPLKWNRMASQSELDHEDESNLGKELGVYRRPTVFPSFCDWLDEEVPVAWLEKFVELIAKTPNLNWLLLTKRPENFVPRLREVQKHCVVDPLDIVDRIDGWISGERIPQNVWVGTSVEDQKRADERIPALLKIPAKLRFLSVEPLLGEVDLKLVRRSFGFPQHITSQGNAVGMPQGIHWVIVGGESGPRSRPCCVEWIHNIVRQCEQAGIPCFVKQLGAHCVTSNVNAHEWPDDTEFSDDEGEGFAAARVRLKHPKGGDPAEWPEELQNVRHFPEVKP